MASDSSVDMAGQSRNKLPATSVVVDHVSKTIRGHMVLKDVSMSLVGGRSYGLRGPNGSGKTMLMRAICGLLRPSKGQVLIDGRRLGRDISFPPHVGALIENPAFLSERTALQNLRLLAAIRKQATETDIRAALASIGLDPEDRRPYRKFSLGMRQRLGIAAALMEDPRLIVVDEPGNGLDRDGVEQLRELLADRRGAGALVVLASHNREDLEILCDEVFDIDAGELVGHRFLDEQAASKPRRALP